jgi:hypothetical protein
MKLRAESDRIRVSCKWAEEAKSGSTLRIVMNPPILPSLLSQFRVTVLIQVVLSNEVELIISIHAMSEAEESYYIFCQAP